MRERELLFRGSRERLKRSILRNGGKVTQDGEFSLMCASKYFCRGLTYRVRGRYEKTEEGYLLRYRFCPTLGTLLWTAVPTVFLLWFSFGQWRCGDVDSAVSVGLFCLLYPAVALWQAMSCHREFRSCFAVATN